MNAGKRRLGQEGQRKVKGCQRQGSLQRIWTIGSEGSTNDGTWSTIGETSRSRARPRGVSGTCFYRFGPPDPLIMASFANP